MRKFLLVIFVSLFAYQSYSRVKITPGGVRIDFGNSRQTDKLYSLLRSFDNITNQSLELVGTNKPVCSIFISVSPDKDEQPLVVKAFRKGTLSVRINQTFEQLKNNSSVKHSLLEMLIAVKCGGNRNRDFVPDWLGLAILEELKFRTDVSRYARQLKYPVLRSLALNEEFPRLHSIVNVIGDSNLVNNRKLYKESCHLAYRWITSTRSYRSKLRSAISKALVKGEDVVFDVSPVLVDTESKDLISEERQALVQEMFEALIRSTTITNRYKAPIAYVKSKFGEFEKVKLKLAFKDEKGDVKETEEKLCSLEDIPQYAENIQESDFVALRGGLTYELITLINISNFEIAGSLRQVWECFEDFNRDDIDDFIENYKDSKKNLLKVFSRYEAIDNLLVSEESKGEVAVKMNSYLVRSYLDIEKSIPKSWPALEDYLDKVEQEYMK